MRGADPHLEYNFFRVLRQWLMEEFLAGFDSICEFGCGPGHNLVAFAQAYPDKKICGLDWAESAVTLVNNVAETHGLSIRGVQFDMFNPDEGFSLDSGSAVLTMGALEQTGDGYGPFIEFLLSRRPALCLHVEPLCELYGDDALLDYVAVRHHKARGLLGDLLGSLRDLEAQGQAELLRVQRVRFGGLLEEGWSYVVWRPCAK